MSTGVITCEEMHWLAEHRDSFGPGERQVVIRLVRAFQQGVLHLGCRL
ncbi:hypothetical protein [Synechococcus sp. RSCCF101]|nr:hypothetical protein [Synechococcus sp. RSCCF101]